MSDLPDGWEERTSRSTGCIFQSSMTGLRNTQLADELVKICPNKVIIRDLASVHDKLARMKSGGAKHLQVISDFDYTLTRAHKDGQSVDGSWGAIEKTGIMPQAFTESANKLRKKYLPIEHDPKRTIAEKTPEIIEWYTQANALLVEHKINVNKFPQALEESNIAFRDRTDLLVETLEEAQVPILILSAGLGNFVVAVLDNFGLNKSQVKVVSNMFDTDESGCITGLRGEMIHVFNKKESTIHDSDYFKDLQARNNVLLLGDSLGDLQMADGVANPDSVLKVGFLNGIDKNEEQYKESYDIVLKDDQTMDVPLAIVKHIIS
eukprot:snap_masked-scaffold14_size734282-processed-gene-1.11 protein:Tk11283 transcript:snap_masked-scaffold14_size734282-processed-gene-1.11-mRNA-1 annotation:"cytosolic 5 -nucleotidase 3a-like isoform x7"